MLIRVHNDSLTIVKNPLFLADVYIRIFEDCIAYKCIEKIYMPLIQY